MNQSTTRVEIAAPAAVPQRSHDTEISGQFSGRFVEALESRRVDREVDRSCFPLRFPGGQRPNRVPERIFSGSPPGGRRGGEIRRQVRQASLAAHFRGERLFADGFERGSSLEESLLSLPSAVG